MEEAAVEDKEERKNDDVKETSQQQATETETSMSSCSSYSLLLLPRLLFSPTRDGDFVLLAKILIETRVRTRTNATLCRVGTCAKTEGSTTTD